MFLLISNFFCQDGYNVPTFDVITKSKRSTQWVLKRDKGQLPLTDHPKISYLTQSTSPVRLVVITTFRTPKIHLTDPNLGPRC